MFITPKFDKNGCQRLASINGRNKEMLMDITVHRLKQGEELVVSEKDMESAILLLQGSLSLSMTKMYTECKEKICSKIFPPVFT